MSKKLKFIDVFSGCGGLSYGLEMAGLECLAAVDFNKTAIETFNLNHKRPVGLKRDLTQFEPEELAEIIGTEEIDLVVGGPPCQGFSTARTQGGANFGKEFVDDPRRDLYKRFLKHVEFFQPKIFVMENVLGIKSMGSGIYFTKIQEASRALGYSVAPVQINCWEFGVPQKRVRQLFIGTRVGLPLFMPSRYLAKTHSLESENDLLEPIVTLGEAICDLPPLEADDGSIESKYDLALRKKHLKNYGDRYIINLMQADEAKKLTWHVSRAHSERDLRDFLLLREGENSKGAITRGEVMETPYSMESFADKYKRQSRYELCSTIVAHLKKDGLMFIHPTQNRSLTPRETARVQSFPDTFQFSGQRGNVYEQVGNAVPPLAGRAIGFAIKAYLKNNASSEARPKFKDSEKTKAIKKLEVLTKSLYLGVLGKMTTMDFLATWNLVHIVHPTLHPETALDRTGEVHMPPFGTSDVLAPYYKRSGWPLALIPIAEEANTRYKNKELTEEDYYFNNLASA
ncbi:DNA cytosine methyltransferase [Polynucleobacter bastaniensis]|uniref:DNA cytosine methyltransferase n=1 Tax=Polynucleobacter bastaniensis TaxID=2081039 RepID=UPI001C0E1624|nr:DNA cytosine methyltransferase [Polynucleobacter bastaniensis]MBU3598801.1 DNA cytosine methyltransferase [Polynucleobacter bastaniensis]